MTPLTETEIAAIDARFNAGEEVWMWCLHHEQHVEKLTEPLSHRIDYVKNHKAVIEIPIRLAEIQPVKDTKTLLGLLKAYDAARAEPQKAYDAAMAEPQKAYDAAMAEPQKAYDAAMAEAQKAYDAAMAEADTPLMALHRSEYPDTSWNGRSIFQ